MNRLSTEKSPYLLQHQNNPVDWYPWGEEAFQKARDENKLIFLSIGYSTCHWCHVMEHDSFEKEDVAAVLNRDFVSIKLDREERPDLDQVYMEAVIALAGRGGWPMSVFLTPDLKPFFGGTFFWREPFKQLLAQIQNHWKTSPEKITATSQELVGHLKDRKSHFSQLAFDFETAKVESLFSTAEQIFAHSFDKTFGGFGSAPKFPRSVDLCFLMRHHVSTGSTHSLEMVEKTLQMMARGGLYDHVGGGFSRYSTDNRWLLPHFEKMLYDNALLTWTYLEAFQITAKPLYAQVARETLDYILRDMTSPEGGFYSAEDADSEGVEGKFYVWTENELSALLNADEFSKVKNIFGVETFGNFKSEVTHGNEVKYANILHYQKDFGPEDKADPVVASALRKLFQAREKRVHPLKDDKVLTSWNGLMIHSLAKAYQVLRDDRYLQAAKNAASFIKAKLWDGKTLTHRYRLQEARFEGTLEDYSSLIFGLLTLAESDLDATWIEWAIELQKIQDEKFSDSEGGGYFFSSSNASDVFLRQKESYDGATPSGNAVSLYNLVRLFALTGELHYKKLIDSQMSWLGETIKKYPAGFCMVLLSLQYMTDKNFEVVVSGKRGDPATEGVLDYLWATFLPHKVLLLAQNSQGSLPIVTGKEYTGELKIYLCRQQTCHSPVLDLESLKKNLA